MDRRNILPDSQEFIDLIDHSSIFEPVVELMGPYIQLSMAEAVVRPPNPDDAGYIHTDGGEALRRIRVSETSWPLQIKVQYFLTDLRKPGSGNFTLFPGSHLRPYPEGDNPVTTATPGAVQLCAEAGDAVIFPHALWHGVSTNHSRRARKSLIYCYSQMCFRTFDFNGHAPDLLDRCTSRQRAPAQRPEPGMAARRLLLQSRRPARGHRRSVTRGTTSQVSWYQRSIRSRSSARTSR